MAQYGLLLRVTHTGKAGDSVHISDIRDGVDLLASFRKAGPVYVPTPAKGGQALLVYSGDVAVSFETGGIRKFIEGGYLLAEFVIGDTLAPAIAVRVEDEGVLVDAGATLFNFVGPGVTATQTAPGQVQIDVPGAAGGNHALLTNLDWHLSGHKGTADRVAGFDAVGAARYYQIGADLQAWDTDLDALSALATTGILTRTGPGTYSTRAITGTAGNIVVTNGDGVAGDPTIDIGANVITTTTALGGDLSGFLPSPTVIDLTIAGEVQGSVLYFNGVNWVAQAPGVAGQVWTTQGVGANPQWTSNAGGDVTGPGASTDNALVRWDGVTGKLIKDSNVLLSNAGDMTFTGGTTLSVDNVAEATAGNGVVVNTIRNYGKSAANPAAPAPTDGDTYYNTALRLPMAYDASRSKWLSVESSEFHFGRDGNTALGQYYRAADGRVMGPVGAAFIGWYAIRSGTVISFAYTRSDNDAADFEIVNQTGAVLHTIPSSAFGGRDIAVNADFNFGDILAVRNKLTGSITSDVVGWLRVKWRV